MATTRTAWIYHLIDPTTGLPFYVGHTTRTLGARLRKHQLDARRYRRTSLEQRVVALDDAGTPPRIGAIDECDGARLALAIEMWWIGEYRLRHRGLILNVLVPVDDRLFVDCGARSVLPVDDRFPAFMYSRRLGLWSVRPRRLIATPPTGT